MNNKNITGVLNGVDDSDVMTKGQFDKIQKYYYFTDKMGPASYNKIRFPLNVDFYPFKTLKNVPQISSTFLILYLKGYYQITFTDFYKGSGELKIITKYPAVSSSVDDNEYKINLRAQSDWTPITINIIKKVQIKPSDPHSVLFFLIDKKLNFLGINYSTFYIKYLHD